MLRPFVRVRVPELMDAPDVDKVEHARAMAGLRRVNAICRPDAVFWRTLRTLATQNRSHPFRILDIATASGDLPIRLSQRFQKAGISAEISACDISPGAVAEATQRAKKCGANVRFFTCDVLSDSLPGEYDAVVCSLFLHHLDPPDAVKLLRNMANASKGLVLVSDLRRSRLGWWGAYAVTRMLSRSPIMHNDGPISVTASYTIKEMQHMAEEAGMRGVVVSNSWPWRLLVSWNRANLTAQTVYIPTPPCSPAMTTRPSPGDQSTLETPSPKSASA